MKCVCVCVGGGGGGGSKFPSLPIPLYFFYLFLPIIAIILPISLCIRCMLPGAPEIKVQSSGALFNLILIILPVDKGVPVHVIGCGGEVMQG